MSCRHLLLNRILRPCLFAIAVGLSVRLALPQTEVTKPSDSPKTLLQVTNEHITVGKRLPSTYLNLLSDGSIECGAIDRNAGGIKKTQVSPVELSQMISALNSEQLIHLGGSYALQRFVFDSWMEWDITISRPSRPVQNITLAFGGGRDYAKLPDALGELGCRILDLRYRCWGAEEPYYKPACTKAAK
jgi:hypothetical protein